MENADARELESAVEGILFASGEPIQTDRICLALSLERAEVEEILRRLRDYYAFERRGMRLLQLEDRWQLCSSPDHAEVIRKAFEIRKPAKLSQPALEALTIIAYYQPTTRAYVDKLRGVDSAYTVGLLLERGLIETCGNLQAPGRPLLYRTTEKFLRSFHISSLDELPPLNEDDAPPQQLRIEDMAQRLTETPEENPPSVALRRHLPPEGGDMGATPQGEETPQESVTEAAEVAGAPEENLTDTPEEAESVSVEIGLESPPPLEESGATAPGGGATRELMLAEYPLILTARRSRKRKASPRKPKRLAGLFRKRRKKKARKRRKTARQRSESRESVPTPPAPRRIRRKAAPRKTKRLAETFRTRRKRPGRKARKRRRIARPKRTAPENRDAISPPESVLEVSTPPKSRESVHVSTPPKAARRKLSGKAVRRCLHCLLFGCWLSWPFC